MFALREKLQSSLLKNRDFLLNANALIRGELIKNKLEFQKRTGTKVEFHSLEPESKKKISKK